jgi:hypothetical protein
MLNNAYFQSENCMFELLQIFKNPQFHDRIFPVVLDELKIYKAQDRVKLIKYWENQTAGLESEIRKLKELSNIHGVSDDLDLYTEIRNTIASLTSRISDINTLSLEQHLKSDFDELLQKVREKFEQDRQQEDNGEQVSPIENSGSNLFKKSRGRTVNIVFYVLLIGTAGAWFIFYPHQTDTAETTNVDRKPDSVAVSDSTGNAHKIENTGETTTAATTPENNEVISYEVRIIVPSNMMNGTVLVDGEPAEILSRNLTFITVRVNQKSGSHHFSIENGNSNCTTDQLIQKDGITLAMCD